MTRAELEVQKQSKARKSAAPKPEKLPKAPKPGRGEPRGAVFVGYEPRVDLLPTEVYVDRKQRAVIRRAWFVVGVVAVLAVLGTGAAYTSAAKAASEAENAQEQTVALLKQVQGFSEVKQVQSDSALIKAGQEVGGSTEIDWGTYLEKVQASLPDGVTITGVQVDSATPLQTFTQATAPLQGSRVATVTVTAASPTLPSIPAWISSLKGLPGYVDANANSVTLGSDDAAGYTTNLTIHVNTDAYDGKYTSKKKEN